MILSLPQEVMVRVLSHLGTAKDIGRTALVCKKLQVSADHDSVWQELAVRRYGEALVRSSRTLYYGTYKQMIQDDNRRGALPTLKGNWKSSWKFNTNHVGQGSFYCCLILGIQYDRIDNKVLFYLDVRGEHDLRPPSSSGFWLRLPDASSIYSLENRIIRGRRPQLDQWGFPDNVKLYEFVSHDETEELAIGPFRNRYKGVLKVNADLFTSHGKYLFCYANPMPRYSRTFGPLQDYNECHLFTLTQGQGLMDVFDSFSSRGETPFDSDTPQSWEQRWRPHLPAS